MQGHRAGLHEEPAQEEGEGDPVHHRPGDLAGEVGEVEGTVLPVEEGGREEDEQPAHGVHDHRLERRLRAARRPRAVPDEPARGDRRHLEEHEQVEQVAGERHPEHPRPEERPQGQGEGLALVLHQVPPRVGEADHGHEGGDEPHERAEGVHSEHDADRKPARGEGVQRPRPPQGVDLDPGRVDLHGNEDREGGGEARDEDEPQVA